MNFFINTASTLMPLAFLYVLTIYLWLLVTKCILNSTELQCTQNIKLYHFDRTILTVPFCPIPFCPYTILSISFCPYHFVRTILSNTILSVYHFVHIILSVPFCPYHFVRYHFVRSPAIHVCVHYMYICEGDETVAVEERLLAVTDTNETTDEALSKHLLDCLAFMIMSTRSLRTRRLLQTLRERQQMFMALASNGSTRERDRKAEKETEEDSRRGTEANKERERDAEKDTQKNGQTKRGQRDMMVAAINMRGASKGVQVRIKQLNAMALFTHCFAHNLNRALVNVA